MNSHNRQKVSIMKARIDYRTADFKAIQLLLGVERHIATSGLDHKLLHLIKMRASQINGCAYCLDMHSKDARAEGETEQRLYSLDAWDEAPYYTDRERAALAWTEAVTSLHHGHVPDSAYEQVRAQFSESEIASLTLAIGMINTWNRLNVAFRTEAGGYKPGMFKNV
jgi:AhpD family alkylhydroperoxidase